MVRLSVRWSLLACLFPPPPILRPQLPPFFAILAAHCPAATLERAGKAPETLSVREDERGSLWSFFSGVFLLLKALELGWEGGSYQLAGAGWGERKEERCDTP